MINFSFIPNLNNDLSLNDSLKNILQNDKKMDFSDILNQREEISKNINTISDITNFDKNNLSTINKKDLEKIVDELNMLNNEDSENYTLEDVVNIINFWLAVDCVDKNNIDLNSFSLNVVEINSTELISNLNSMELDSNLFNESIILNDVFSVFELSDTDIKMPILKIESTNEFINLNANLFENINTQVSSLEIDMSMIKELGFENITVEDLEQIVNTFGDGLLSKLDLSKIDLSNENIVNILKSINLSSKSIDIDNVSSESKNGEILNIMDVNILEDNQELTFTRGISNNVYIDNNSGLSDFLLQQRISFDELTNSNIEDSIETLLKTYKNDDKNVDSLDKFSEVDFSSENIDIFNDFAEVLNQNSNSSVPTFAKGNINTNSIEYTLRYDFLSNDIIKNLQYMKDNDIKQLVLKVNPRELGEVSIQLTKSSDISKLILVVEREELFSVLKKDVAQISQQLKGLGMDVDNVYVQMKSNSRNSNLEQSLDFTFSSFDKGNETSKKDTNKKNNYNNKANEIESIKEDTSLNREVEDGITLFA